MNWRFENTGFRNGMFNIARDEALAREMVQRTALPTVRVYGWDPAAISLGWSQSMEEIDVAKAHEQGVDVVRRPTGGRAILHSEELTYSVVMPARGRNVMAVYDDISRALVCGLKRLGADVMLEKSQLRFPKEYAKPSSTACFTSMARYEIHIDGKKVVGSAQRRYSNESGNEVVLQHGSILLGNGHKKITEFLRVSDTEKRHIQQELDNWTIDVSSAVGRHVEFDEVADAVRFGFEEEWRVTFATAQQPITVEQ